MKNLILSLAILLLLSSCSNYYKVITTNNPAPSEIIKTINLQNKFFILRTDSAAFSINNIAISNDSKEVNCFLTELPDTHRFHLPERENKKLKYSKADNEDNSTAVLSEVHLFTAPGVFYKNGLTTIPLGELIKTDVIEKDKKRTHTSHAIGIGIGTVFGVVLAGVVFAASFATKWTN